MPLQASCVCSLVAHAGRSIVKDLPSGNKLISKDCRNVSFEDVKTKTIGAPEHADNQIQGESASYCTKDNVQDYALTGRNPKEPMYELIAISSVQETEGETTPTWLPKKTCPQCVVFPGNSHESPSHRKTKTSQRSKQKRSGHQTRHPTRPRKHDSFRKLLLITT